MSLSSLQVLAKFRDAFLALDEFAAAGGFDELNKTKPAAKTTAKKSAPVEEPEDDEPDVPSADEAAKMSVVELRKLAVALGLEAQKVKADILAELDELRDDDSDDEEEFEDDEDEAADDVEDEGDSDDEDDDEPGEDDPYTREELEELGLKELRNIAKEEGVKSTEYRGADKDKLIELILGLDEDDDEGDEDADDSDDVEDSDDEEDEEEELDEAAIRKMPVSELLKLADEVGVTISRRIKTMKDAKAKKEALVDAIMASAEDDEDDDE